MFEGYEAASALADVPAGAALASALDELNISTMDYGPRVDVLYATARLVAFAQSQLLRCMAAVAQRSVGDGFDADEVAFALRMPRRAAQTQVALAQDLTGRLPDVLTALGRGDICLARARVFSEELVPVQDDAVAAAIAAKLLPPSTEWTASQLRARLRREVIAADPDAAGRRYERSLNERRVCLEANSDTTANLSAVFLPPAKASAAYERIDALARGLKHGGDERTLDQLRADVLLDLLTGVAPGGAAIARPGTVELIVPLATLTGQSDAPGRLAGYGPVLADIARQVATQQARAPWRFRVYAADGTLLHNGTTRVRPCPPEQADVFARYPQADLRRWIGARDETCRAPGCTAPARICDVDHTDDWAAGGRTSHENLGLLCRHHHRLKHEGGYTLIQSDPGRFTWISPSLKVYDVEADPPW
jgi:hypothetical protein